MTTETTIVKHTDNHDLLICPHCDTDLCGHYNTFAVTDPADDVICEKALREFNDGHDCVDDAQKS